MPFIQTGPLQYPINSADSQRRWEDTRAPTIADFKQFRKGDLWLDTSSDDWYILCYKDQTQGIWRMIAGTAGAAEDFTPDSGGQVGPDALNNINFLGDSVGYLNGIHFFGDPANNTISAKDLRNITVYVVDPTALETEYQTIQSAIDAANADGGGTVYVRPGTYTEDLTLYDAVDIMAAVATPAGYQTTIVGVHTPPAAGAMSFRNLALSDTTDILNSAVAGTATIVIIDCVIDVANGYTFNMPNWTGLIAFMNSHCVGTEDGFIDIGAGGGDLLVLNSSIGVGTTNVAAVSGTTRIIATNIQCDFDTVSQGTTNIRDAQWIYTLLFSDDSSGIISHCTCLQDVDVAINHTSSGLVSITNTTIESSGNPDVITGTGDLQMGSVIFNLSASIAAGITQLASAYQITGPIEIIPEDESVAAEDAWIKFNIPSGGGFSFGIDNSDSDKYKLTTGASPSAGTELIIIDPNPTTPLSDPDFFFNGAFLLVQDTVAGGSTDISCQNLDNSNAASNAFISTVVAGTSGGDPFYAMVVPATRHYVLGIDNSDSDILKINTHNATLSPSSGTNIWSMTAAGERTMPLQPTFLATGSGGQVNVTGNNTLYTVIFATEILDYNADFDATSTFTAPSTGAYRFNATINLQQLGALATTGVLYIQTSNRLFQSSVSNVGAMRDVNNTLLINNAVIADMDAADTCIVQVKVSNMAGDTVDVGGNGSLCYFGGSLEY